MGVRQKKMSEISDKDFDGHESYTSTEVMYKAYKGYYGEQVGQDSIVKMVDFVLTKSSGDV